MSAGEVVTVRVRAEVIEGGERRPFDRVADCGIVAVLNEDGGSFTASIWGEREPLVRMVLAIAQEIGFEVKQGGGS